MEENNETKTGKIMETNRCYDIDYGDDTYINVIRNLAAETDGNSPPVKTEKEETTEKEVVVCKENVIESKNTEDSTTYDAGAGVLVTEYYGQDVRFRNEDGDW